MTSPNTNSLSEIFVPVMKRHGEKYFDMQEKCYFFRQLTANGRKTCRDAKMDFYMSIVMEVDGMLKEIEKSFPPTTDANGKQPALTVKWF